MTMEYAKQRVGRKYQTASRADATALCSSLLYYGWTTETHSEAGGVTVRVKGRTPSPTHAVFRTLLRRAKMLPVGKSTPIGDRGRWREDHWGEVDMYDLEATQRVLRREQQPKKFVLDKGARTLIRTR